MPKLAYAGRSLRLWFLANIYMLFVSPEEGYKFVKTCSSMFPNKK
jgi:hypothetical protein